jgi:hypothetical protein
MSCALTQGFNLDCREGIGGVKEVYIIETDNLASVTEVSGVVTAITKAQGKRFYKYNLVRETSNATETITASEQNGTLFYAQQVQLIINRRQASVRNEIMLLAKNRITIVVVENQVVSGTQQNRAWLYGRVNGLLLNAGSSESGTAWGDRNGYTLPFTGNEVELAPEVQYSLLAALETPGT